MSAHLDPAGIGVAELLASLPPLLGFTPHNALVTLDCTRTRVPEIRRTAHLSLEDERTLIDGYLEVLRSGDHLFGRRVMMFIFVGGTFLEAVEGFERCLDAERLIEPVSGGGKHAIAALMWAKSIATGAPWRRFDIDQNGVIPDVRSTLLAASSAHNGQRTFSSREEMETALRPTDLAAAERNTRRVSEPTSSDGVALLGEFVDAIRAADRGTFDPTAEQIVTLARAYRYPFVINRIWSVAIGSKRAALAHVSTVLAQNLTAPCSARPLMFTAVCGLLDGGSLGGVSARLAADADPNDRTCQVIAEVAAHGITPGDLRSILQCVQGL